jgi:hypothetical protein
VGIHRSIEQKENGNPKSTPTRCANHIPPQRAAKGGTMKYRAPRRPQQGKLNTRKAKNLGQKMDHHLSERHDQSNDDFLPQIFCLPFHSRCELPFKRSAFAAWRGTRVG